MQLMNKLYENITLSLNYLNQLIKLRLQAHLSKEVQTSPFLLPRLTMIPDENPLHQFLLQHQLEIEEYIILLLALTPHLQPSFFDSIIQEYLPQGGDLPEIGGIKGSNHRGMLPTGETAQFILAGSDLNKRLEIQQLLLVDSTLIKQSIISLETVKEGEPVMSGRLIISEEWLNKIVFGKNESPKFGPDFPAKKLSTEMNWDDLVLNGYTHSQITDIQIWLQHNAIVMQDEVLQKKVKPGYRVLF